MALNFKYFTGQVFDLDQKTMNKMIEDVHALKFLAGELLDAHGESIDNDVTGWYSREKDELYQEACKLLGREK